ncbi:MAG: response regulator [Anaerolineae bacterium]
MSTQSNARRRNAFILRLWETRSIPPDPSSQWRLSLENVHTGEKHKFPDLESLDAFLRARIAADLSGTDQTRKAAASREPEPSAKVRADRLDPEWAGASILLVEADDGIRHWLRRWLEAAFPGSTVSDVDSDEAAVARADSESPDVILVDVGPPSESSLRIFGRLRSAAPSARIVVLGTEEDAENRQKVLSAGADAYVKMWRIRQELPRTLKEQLAAGPGKAEDRTVVCIEDEPDMISLIKLALQRHRVKLIGALGGEEGLTKVRQVKPDLVLLDLMMPDVDGVEVYKRLKADEGLKHIPIIVITALDPLRTAKQGMDPRLVDGFIRKPFVPHELVRKVSSALELVA